MRLLVGIDDTDSLESDHGTGRVSRDLGARLATDHDLHWVGSVRQQFLVAPEVPYTTHNSAACLVFEAEDRPFDSLQDAVVTDAGCFLERVMADGADPGLCVAEASTVPDAVTEFGHRAQEEVLEKRAATDLADETGLFLDAYGGTGDGVIGALGSVGLTAAGDDGRFVAYGRIREYGERVSVTTLVEDGIRVVDDEGTPVDSGTVLTGDWVRPQLRGGEPRLPVEPADEEMEGVYRPANRKRAEVEDDA